ncbi:MAG: sigma-70 family RNA polymerase sigma factor [Minicystis sp.]
MSDPMRKKIEGAIAGHPPALRELLDEITPAVHVAVADILRRHLPASAWSRARHEVEDLTQEILFKLFEEGGKRLLKWDPDLGLSLNGYVKVISRNEVRGFLRRKQNTTLLTQDSREAEGIDDIALPNDGPALHVEQKELVAAVLAEMDREMTAEARPLFRMLFYEALDVDEVCARVEMTPNAVHVRRSRFLKQATEVTRRILSDASG